MSFASRQKQKAMSVFTNGDIRQSFEPIKAASEVVSDSLKRKYEEMDEGRRNLEANKRFRRILPDQSSDDEADEADDKDWPETQFTKDNMPESMQKYWWQRYRLFSLFDKGIRMDLEGWWSVTPENIAAHIAERCRCNLVVDAFTGVGGNAIQFALTCEKVIAIDNDPLRLACAAHNASIYGVADRIHFILADFPTWLAEYMTVKDNEPIDVLFLSPPWGGVNYQTMDTPASSPKKPIADYSLDSLKPLKGQQLFDLAKTATDNIALFLPRHTSVDQIAALTTEKIEIEEAWMQDRFKALTVYTGELLSSNL